MQKSLRGCLSRRAVLASGALAIGWPARAQSSVLRVGPGLQVSRLAQAAALAHPGMTIEVQAGLYAADVTTWTHDDLTLRAVGGRVRMLADGAAAEDKAIWVIRGQRITVEGFDFEGAKVAHRNGAGIRFESGSLTVRDCRFLDNEMGLLTSDNASAELVIEDSEFAHNLRPDGHNHNLYVGAIAKLAVSGSYFHHATIGHLFKSRAADNRILYNRLTDERGGRASYELDLPNGGIAIVVGNILEQGAQTENPSIVSFGAEGYRWPINSLALSHNTIVDLLPSGGRPLRVAVGATEVRAVNNLLLGAEGRIDGAGSGDFRGNVYLAAAERARLMDARYRLKAGVVLTEALAEPGVFHGSSLLPAWEYSHPRHTSSLNAPIRLQGALQEMAPKS